MTQSILPTVGMTSDAVTQYLYYLEHHLMDGGFGPISGMNSLVSIFNTTATGLTTEDKLDSFPTNTEGSTGPLTIWQLATPDDLPAGFSFISVWKTELTKNAPLFSSVMYGTSSALDSGIGLGTLSYVSETSLIGDSVDPALYQSTDDPKEYQSISYLRNRFPIAQTAIGKVGKTFVVQDSSKPRVGVDHSGNIIPDQESEKTNPSPGGFQPIINGKNFAIPHPSLYAHIGIAGKGAGYPYPKYQIRTRYVPTFHFTSTNGSSSFEVNATTITQNNIPTVSTYYGQMISPMQTHYNHWSNTASSLTPMGITMAPFLIGRGKPYNAPYLPYTNAIEDSIDNHVLRSYRVDAPTPSDGQVLLEHRYTAKDIHGVEKTFYASQYPIAVRDQTPLEIPQVLRGMVYLTGTADTITIPNLGFLPEIVHLMVTAPVGEVDQSDIWDTLTFRNPVINATSGQTIRNPGFRKPCQVVQGDHLSVTFLETENGSIQITRNSVDSGLGPITNNCIEYVIVGRSGPIDACYLIDK